MKQLYSIVIPVYKSEKSLGILISRLSNIAEKFEYSFEVIFVNDSPFCKETLDVLNEIQQDYKISRIINLHKNQGQQIATLVGMSQAKGDYIITMDDDLQHSPDDIPLLIREMHRTKVEGLFAVPNYLEKKHSLWRNFGSFVIKKTDAFFLKKPKGLMLSSFRILTKDLNSLLVKNYNAMPSVSSLMLNSTNHLGSLEVKHQERNFDKSNYSLPKLVTLALNSILHYSSLPLRFLAVIGLMGFIGSLIFIVLTVVRRLMLDIEFPGYASTVTLISFFGGLNLFAVGLIGEYLIRVIREQQKVKLSDLIKQ